jgi:SAM-dependent methyltransferase
VSGWRSAVGARLIRGSLLADQGFKRFDQLRSFLITSFAGDGTLEAYNDLTYGATRVYDASTPVFRTRLFNWEAELVDRVFPKPPSRILVGGAGGGREAFELVARGYEVTAFEPSEVLARSMAEKAKERAAPVDVLLGRYEDLPRLRDFASRQPVDLTARPHYAAALLGWSSFSHIRRREGRIATLQRFAAVTDGPVIASFFLRPPSTRPRVHPLARLSIARGWRSEGDSFTPHIGYFHLSSADELAHEVADAGLVLVDASYNDSEGYWPWIAVARPDVAAGSSAAG